MSPSMSPIGAGVESVRPPRESDILLLGRTLGWSEGTLLSYNGISANEIDISGYTPDGRPYITLKQPMWVREQDQSFWYTNGYFSQEMLDTWKAVKQANKDSGINTDF
jgi:hypothetical protein